MAIEKLKYKPERHLPGSGINKVGVVVFVINQREEIWAVQEQGKHGHQEEAETNS